MHVLHALLAAGQNIPEPGNTPLPGNVQDQLNTVLGWIKYLGLGACIAGLFMAAGRMALSHSGRGTGGGEHIAHLGYVAGALVIIGGATAIVGFLV